MHACPLEDLKEAFCWAERSASNSEMARARRSSGCSGAASASVVDMIYGGVAGTSNIYVSNGGLLLTRSVNWCFKRGNAISKCGDQVAMPNLEFIVLRRLVLSGQLGKATLGSDAGQYLAQPYTAPWCWGLRHQAINPAA